MTPRPDDSDYYLAELAFAGEDRYAICYDCGYRRPTYDRCPRCGTDAQVLYDYQTGEYVVVDLL